MILVIGGAGFVGSAFARAAGARGVEHAVVEPDNYARHMGRACRILINANGSSRKLLAEKSPLEDFDLNVRSVRATLADFRCDLYVHISSCDVYPDCSTPAATREEEAPAVERQSPYGFHKYLAEQCVRHGAQRWLIFRMGGFVGPGLKKNAIYDILHGGKLWLDPASELQFLSTDDAARLILDAVERGVTNEVFNLCGSGVVRLEEAMEWAGRRVPVEPSSPRVRYEAGIEKISRLVCVPTTRETVRTFVEAERRNRGL